MVQTHRNTKPGLKLAGLLGLLVLGSLIAFGKPGNDPKEAKPKENDKLQVMKVSEVKRAGRWLVGKVTDTEGKPLEGALVKAQGSKGPPYTSVVRRGQFYVMAPPGDRYTLTITMTRYQTFEKILEK